MGTFVFTSAGSVGMSGKTFGQAKRQVARILGAQDEPESVGAGDALHLAIDKLNLYEWNFLTVAGTSLTTTDNKITLPTPFLKPVSLLIGGVPLLYVSRGEWDRVVRGSSTGSTQLYYTLYNSELSGTCEILPSAADGASFDLYYFRPIAKPADDSETLDVISRLERALILEAQGQLMIESGDVLGKADRLLSRAEVTLFTALGQDRLPGPDEDTGFTPTQAWASKGYDLGHAQTYIDTDGDL